MVTRGMSTLPFLLVAAVALTWGGATPEVSAEAVPLSISKIYFEYNSSAHDLGGHVSLDGEDWNRLKMSCATSKSLGSGFGTK